MLTKGTGFADEGRTHKNTLKTENEMEIIQNLSRSLAITLTPPFQRREESG